MYLLDVNVLVYAHRPDMEKHDAYRNWVESLVNSDQAFGISDLVLSGYVRIVTHPKAFIRPTSLENALSYVESLRERPNRVPVSPGERHWDIFVRLCRAVNARGNVVPDAWHAALAVEIGAEWATDDLGFRRFPGLRVHHPLS